MDDKIKSVLEVSVDHTLSGNKSMTLTTLSWVTGLNVFFCLCIVVINNDLSLRVSGGICALAMIYFHGLLALKEVKNGIYPEYLKSQPIDEIINSKTYLDSASKKCVDKFLSENS
jgi:hypothetical protein